MEFPNTTPKEDEICFREGFRIFGELRKKYSNENVRDLDIVLNSLCCALVRLANFNVSKEDYGSFILLVTSILEKNLRKPLDDDATAGNIGTGSPDDNSDGS